MTELSIKCWRNALQIVLKVILVVKILENLESQGTAGLNQPTR